MALRALGGGLMSDLQAEEERELKAEMIQYLKSLVERGFVTGIGGNISARFPGTEEIWITPSGLYKPKLEPEDLLKIDLEGNILEGLFKPTSEWRFHTVIYKKRADVNAVVHTHNPVALGLTLAGVKIKPITVEAAIMLARVPIVPFRYPGTEELSDLVGENIMGNRLLLLQNHGVIGVGYDLSEAVSAIEILEECARMMLVASQFGEPAELTSNDIELVKKLYKI
jgi:L-fuculose-phosphate aldolase